MSIGHGNPIHMSPGKTEILLKDSYITEERVKKTKLHESLELCPGSVPSLLMVGFHHMAYERDSLQRSIAEILTTRMKNPRDIL